VAEGRGMDVGGSGYVPLAFCKKKSTGVSDYMKGSVLLTK